MVFTTWCADTRQVHSFARGALANSEATFSTRPDLLRAGSSGFDGLAPLRAAPVLGSHNRRTLGFVTQVCFSPTLPTLV